MPPSTSCMDREPGSRKRILPWEHHTFTPSFSYSSLMFLWGYHTKYPLSPPKLLHPDYFRSRVCRVFQQDYACQHNPSAYTEASECVTLFDRKLRMFLLLLTSSILHPGPLCLRKQEKLSGSILWFLGKTVNHKSLLLHTCEGVLDTQCRIKSCMNVWLIGWIHVKGLYVKPVHSNPNPQKIQLTAN